MQRAIVRGTLATTSGSFVLAGTLRLTPDEYARWLASPAPGPSALSDSDAMYAGWGFDGKRPTGAWRAKGTVEETLARVLSWAATSPWFVLLRYQDGAFLFFVMSAMGAVDAAIEELFVNLRSASAFKSSERDTIAYWSEPSGLFDYGGLLALATVEPGRSAFVGAMDRERLATELSVHDTWFGAYLGDASDELGRPKPDAWSRPAFVDANFVALAKAAL